MVTTTVRPRISRISIRIDILYRLPFQIPCQFCGSGERTCRLAVGITGMIAAP